MHVAIKYNVMTQMFILNTGMSYFCLLQSFREKNRASKLFNNLSAVSEAIPALGWVSVVRSQPFFLFKLM